jgi:hypothetical protein
MLEGISISMNHVISCFRPERNINIRGSKVKYKDKHSICRNKNVTPRGNL